MRMGAWSMACVLQQRIEYCHCTMYTLHIPLNMNGIAHVHGEVGMDLFLKLKTMYNYIF